MSDRVTARGASAAAVTHDEPLPDQTEGDPAALAVLHGAARGSHLATNEARGGQSSLSVTAGCLQTGRINTHRFG